MTALMRHMDCFFFSLLSWTNEVESLSKQSLRSPHRSVDGGGAVRLLLDKVADLSKQSRDWISSFLLLLELIVRYPSIISVHFVFDCFRIHAIVF